MCGITSGLLSMKFDLYRIKKMCRLFIILALVSIGVTFSGGSAEQDNLTKLSAANNELGVKLYHRLTNNDLNNLFFSPFSLSTAFGMLFIGTGGNSAKQLRTSLGYNAAKLCSNKVSSAFNQYLTMVLPGNDPDDNSYILNIANELLISENFNANSNYIEEVKDRFRAYIENVDFMGNADQIVEEVNDWVKQQTHGKIDKLLTELSSSTVMVILNAIYFKGTWQTQFNKKLTTDGAFYNYGQEDEAKNVPIMHVKEKFPYYETDDYQLIELPYKGKDISMIILLPKNRDGLQDIERSITSQKINDFAGQLNPTTVILSLPRFKIEYSREMTPDFKALGAKDIFDYRSANFSGITQLKGLFVSQVVHKAFVEVNEEGSEAAASSGIVVGTRTVHRDPVFLADHPFMFMILDKRNDLVLFLGRVTNL